MGKYDFSGWATRNDLKCSDGRIIIKDAFKHNSGRTVPLIWNHDHNDPLNVLGHALLENRDEGVYAYCKFNDTEAGKNAKMLVQHGDVTSLSIYANKLKQKGPNVIHGEIREVSLVLAGANPGAYIDSVVCHGEDSEDFEATIFVGEDSLCLSHADEEVKEEKKEGESKMAEQPKEKTVQEVFDELTEEQKTVVYALIGQALEAQEEEKGQGGNDNVKHNVFDQDYVEDNTLMHAEIFSNAVEDAKAKRYGSLRESLIQHAAINNIDKIELLFPEAKALDNPPAWIKENEDWVADIMHTVKHTPFSRVKSVFGKLDEAEARARGYIKGKEKANLKLSVLNRKTEPTTVYIKMAMDRDDVIDITDFDVVAWQRAEMRGRLDKELARAMLIGDGRDDNSDDKIDPLRIRPVLTDDDMFTIKYTVTDGKDYKNDFNSASENDSEAKGIIRAAIKARKGYKGSGQPTLYTTEDLLTELLLIEDQNGRLIYESEAKLATAMRVKKIVTVPEMESLTDVYGIIVNMADYNTGADKGGAVNTFDDFDIDFNQMKYLMETRMSGALVKPYSAIVLKKQTATEPEAGE